MTGAETPPAAPRVTVHRVGAEGEPVVVVENFVADPAALVDKARTAPFERIGQFYPGVRAPVPPDYLDAAFNVLRPILIQVFGCRMQISFTRALYSMMTDPPGQLQLAQCVPHVDSVDADSLAVLHYLCTDAGGTSFYRHRATGFETITLSRQRVYLDQLQVDFERLGAPSPGYISGDTPIFERIGGWPAVYNRALIYRGSLLHCATVLKDTILSADIDQGRLTIASFLTGK